MASRISFCLCFSGSIIAGGCCGGCFCGADGADGVSVAIGGVTGASGIVGVTGVVVGVVGTSGVTTHCVEVVGVFEKLACRCKFLARSSSFVRFGLVAIFFYYQLSIAIFPFIFI